MSPLDLPARIPPHNLDAERAVLGAVLLEGRESLPRVIELLRSSDFYTDAHRTIYETMQGLFDRSEPVDLITLSEDLRRDGTLESVGGRSEEHTSELQSQSNLVCRLLLEKKKVSLLDRTIRSALLTDVIV